MNFRRILSKSSLKSSIASGKSLPQTEEVSKLQCEIELLKQTIDSLKVSAESRDVAIGTLAREKEKLYVELKSSQRTNRNLHQQLVDERDIHSKEKELLVNEINRISKQSDYKVIAPPSMETIEDYSKRSLNDELKAKDEVIFNMGTKYLKIKTSKLILYKKFEKLQVENKKRCEAIITLLSENRRTLNKLWDKLIKCSTISPSSKKYLKLLQLSANLHYENTQFKIHLSSRMESIESNVNCHLSETSPVIGLSRTKLDDINKSMFLKGREMRRHRAHPKLQKRRENFRNIKNVFPFQGIIYRSLSDSCLLRSAFKGCSNSTNVFKYYL